MNTAGSLSLVILISGNGSNLQAIIDAIQHGNLKAKISAVISNRPQALGLQRAEQHGIPAIALDHKQFTSREAFDARLTREIERFHPDVIVLAGYMRILTDEFIQHFSPNLLNIHPSLLPKYQGLHTHQRVLQNKDAQHGVSIHVVTPDLDAGPIILQGQFEVESSDDAVSLQHKAHRLEHQMYPLVIQWLSEKRLTLIQGIPEFDDKQLHKPLSFNKL